MTRRTIALLSLIVLLPALALAGSAFAAPEPAQCEGPLAIVEETELLIVESLPVQVVARGYLNDPATRIHRITQTVEGDTIRVRIYTARDEDVMAAQVLVPFDESVALDLAGLEPGAYTVDVNGVTATLTLDEGMLAAQ